MPSRPVSHAEGLVGIEPAHIEQHHHGLDVGDQAERSLSVDHLRAAPVTILRPRES